MNETHFSYRYIGRYSGQEIKFNRQEMSEVRFFSPEQIDETITSGGQFGADSAILAKEIFAGKFEKF